MKRVRHQSDRAVERRENRERSKGGEKRKRKKSGRPIRTTTATVRTTASEYSWSLLRIAIRAVRCAALHATIQPVARAARMARGKATREEKSRRDPPPTHPARAATTLTRACVLICSCACCPLSPGDDIDRCLGVGFVNELLGRFGDVNENHRERTSRTSARGERERAEWNGSGGRRSERSGESCAGEVWVRGL